jgi:hypothetical protein
MWGHCISASEEYYKVSECLDLPWVGLSCLKITDAADSEALGIESASMCALQMLRSASGNGSIWVDKVVISDIDESSRTMCRSDILDRCFGFGCGVVNNDVGALH